MSISPDNSLRDIINKVYFSYKEFAIFETLKLDKDNFRSYIFISPVKKLILKDPKEIKSFFIKLEKILENGFYTAGFFSYELGYFLDYKEKIEENFSFPLAYFLVFKEVYIYDHKKAEFLTAPPPIETPPQSINFNFKIKNLQLNVSKNEYLKSIQKIKEYLYSGDVYQINYTIKQKFNFSGSVLGLYNHLTQTQKVSYAAFLKTDQFNILSFSPELFFRKESSRITTKPMKGTISRGKTLYEDKIQAKKLYLSTKNKAENIMIVDLLRNDLGKLSNYGGVKVEKLFEVEKYETLFQMTSTISAEIKKHTTLFEILKATFPSGSVTGTPKIRAMEIIKELEKEPRGVYTGAVGFITPFKDAVFNVAIRTLFINKNNKAELGIGSGIVVDSLAEKEYEECKLKSKFLTTKLPEFQLIETMLFCKNFKNYIKEFAGLKLNISKENFKYGIFLLDLHLKRLQNSSFYFDFRFNKEAILEKIEQLYKKLNQGFFKIRLLLSKNGEIKIEKTPVDPQIFFSNKIEKICISKKTVDQNNVFLYHKTTNRKFYDKEWKTYFKKGYFDVVFLNKNGLITEASRANVFVKINNNYYTPKLSCGVLAGVTREFILKQNPNIKETELKIEDLRNSQTEVFLSNAIIGLRKVKIG